MNEQPALNFKLGTLNLRKELRIALLAAMETCWVFAIVVFLSALMKSPQPLTPLPFFIAYWLALLVGRTLPQFQRAWIVLQIAAVAIAFITIAAVARAEIYPDLKWYDITWLPRFASALLSITHGFAVEHIVSAGVIYVFIRGLGFAQRPLTVWFTGYQFRLGIVIFAGLFLAAAFFRQAMDSGIFELWIFIYFFLSLLAMALARIDEMGANLNYSARWIVTFLAAIALVLFIGLGVLQIFTLDTAQAMLMLLAPVWWLMSIILLLAAIPIGYLLDWLITRLRPLFEGLSQVMQTLQNTPLGELAKNFSQTQDVSIDPTLIAVLKTILVVVVVLLIGYWLARSLNRRMQKTEDEQYWRESIGDEDADEQSRRDAMKKRAKPHPQARNLSAETIRRIYAALSARAADTGVPRRAAETPYEFLPRLEEHWREESDNLRAITEAYVNVHYAERDTSPEQMKQVKEAWETLKRKT